MVLFDIFDDWFISIESYTAFVRLSFIFRVLHFNIDWAKMMRTHRTTPRMAHTFQRAVDHGGARPEGLNLGILLEEEQRERFESDPQ